MATITRSFRLDSELVRRLPILARKYGNSENQLVSKWLSWRVDIDPLIPTFVGLILSKETFDTILESADTNLLEVHARELGQSHFSTSRTLFESAGETLTFVRYLQEVLSDHGQWFRIEGNVTESSTQITIQHDLSIKWSIFLKAYISGAYEIVSREKLLIDVKGRFLKIHLRPEAR